MGEILSGQSLATVTAVAHVQRKASNHPENKDMYILPFLCLKREKGREELEHPKAGEETRGVQMLKCRHAGMSPLWGQVLFP